MIKIERRDCQSLLTLFSASSSHCFFSPFFFHSYSPSPTLFSPSIFLLLAISLLLSFRGATMCVVRRGSRQGRLANNTPGPSGPSSFPASSRPSRPHPAAMPPREKGKKVPKIQDRDPQIVFYECLNVPVGPKPHPLCFPPPFPPVQTSLVIRDHLRQPPAG